MSIIEDLKSVGKTLNDIGKVDEYQKILESWQQIMMMKEKIIDLEKEIEELKQKLEAKGKTTKRDGAYYVTEGENETGPICSRCWEKDKDQITLQPNKIGPWNYLCPECKNKFSY